ncbi:hypothetical protein E2605_18275 [Dysgonomonas capnocytophagoides]|uniref:DUF4157 domain-containing protein n=1 Tax=Dysgonomonas capnocytophagoides TaxID=45254 RepID=A0A4Y8KTY4_9BACT|nr:hypothetical protein [Dysgonomonas capnocytophagoides]TFD92790.1 hypothetical protein E2605_18275 [Dysgonomonas capnocytophagoides]
MKVIYNKYLPIKGYVAINLFGLIFARKEFKPLSKVTENHERIHTTQMKELLFVFFYIWYGIEWIVRLFQYQDRKEAYLNISFEREAYKNQSDLVYLKVRKHYQNLKYLSISKK